MLTLQEAFDKIVAHVKSDDFAYSIDRYGNCAYRGSNGARCFIGVLIPDEEYRGTFEGYLIDACQAEVSTIRELNTEELVELQMIHDRGERDNATVTNLLEALRSYAHSHGLVYTYSDDEVI